MSSELSQITRASLIFRISFNCGGVNTPAFSYQKRSPLRVLENCSPIKHANVGPTSEPG